MADDVKIKVIQPIWCAMTEEEECKARRIKVSIERLLRLMTRRREGSEGSIHFAGPMFLDDDPYSKLELALVRVEQAIRAGSAERDRNRKRTGEVKPGTDLSGVTTTITSGPQ